MIPIPSFSFQVSKGVKQRGKVRRRVRGGKGKEGTWEKSGEVWRASPSNILGKNLKEVGLKMKICFIHICHLVPDSKYF